MAFLADSREEDEEVNGMDVISSSQAAGIESQAGPAAGAAKGGSGQFTNIQDYIEANRPKTQELAGKITGGVAEEAKGLKSGLEQRRESFLGQEGKFGAGQQEFIKQQVEQAGRQQPAAEPVEGAEQQAPQYYQPSAEDVKRFRGLATGEEQAPELGEQRRQAADLQRRSKGFETSAGRFEGLQKLVGRQAPTYGRGQRQLDQLLLAGDKASKVASIRGMREATQGLGEQVGGLESDIAAGRRARMSEAQDLTESARVAQRESVEGLSARARQARQGALSQEDLQRIGLDTSKFQSLYGVDPTKYIGRGGRANREDLARLESLASLAGAPGTQKIYDEQSIYDPQGLQEAVAAARGRFQGDVGDVMGRSYTQDYRYMTKAPRRSEYGFRIPGEYETTQVPQSRQGQAQQRKAAFDALTRQYDLGTSITAEGQAAPEIYDPRTEAFAYGSGVDPEFAAAQSAQTYSPGEFIGGGTSSPDPLAVQKYMQGYALPGQEFMGNARVPGHGGAGIAQDTSEKGRRLRDLLARYQT